MTTDASPRPRCPQCGSTRTRFRHRTQDRICESCPNIWKDPADAKPAPRQV